MTTFARTSILGLLLVALTPVSVFAQAAPATASTPMGFQSDGIYGCSVTGAMSVGTMAGSGTFVPVNDAAVTLNTGYLVYDECVLREIVDRERESATSAFTKQAVNSINTERNGGPQYVTNRTQARLDVANKTTLARLQDGTLNTLNPMLKGPVTTAFARRYQAAVNTPNQQFACSYSDLNGLYTGNPQDIFGALGAIGTVGCDPLLVTEDVTEYISDEDVMAVDDQNADLAAGRGFYSLTDNNPDPLAQQILTPSSVVQESFQQILGSPFRQLESANDVGQMIGSLFAGISVQAISNTQGLAGLSQNIGGQPSYVNQVAAQSSQSLVGSAVNAALKVLVAAQQTESAYNQLLAGIANNLSQTITTLRSNEAQCWSNIIANVCATPLSANNTCTAVTQQCNTTNNTNSTNYPNSSNNSGCPTGPTLRVATSTQFSQAIISSQIASYASTTVTSLNNSNTALGLIAQLIAGVSNTNSADAQSLALQQEDSLVHQGVLHNQNDVTNMQQQSTSIKGTMATLVTDTQQAWGDSMDPSIGWCNWQNPDVITMWINKWKI